jgi:hypothetical protein
MWTSIQEIRYWGTRIRFTRAWGQKVYSEDLAATRKCLYANLLTASFSHLFNVRLKQSGRAI